jgi:hypothetical protein
MSRISSYVVVGV